MDIIELGWRGANRRPLQGAGYQRFWEQDRGSYAPTSQRYVDTRVFPAAEGA